MDDFMIELVTAYTDKNIVTNKILQRRETEAKHLVNLLVEMNPIDRIED